MKKFSTKTPSCFRWHRKKTLGAIAAILFLHGVWDYLKVYLAGYRKKTWIPPWTHYVYADFCVSNVDDGYAVVDISDVRTRTHAS
jgi:hypothetical protein